MKKTTRDMLYTVSLTLNGNRATGGPYPGGRTEIRGAAAGDGIAYIVMALVQFLTFGPGTIPEEKMRATVQSFGRFLADMLLPKNVARDEFVSDFVSLVLRHRQQPLGLRAEICDIAMVASEVHVAQGSDETADVRMKFRDGITASYSRDRRYTTDIGPFRFGQTEVWVCGERYLVPRGVREYLAKIDLVALARRHESDLGDGMHIRHISVE